MSILKDREICINEADQWNIFNKSILQTDAALSLMLVIRNSS